MKYIELAADDRHINKILLQTRPGGDFEVVSIQQTDWPLGSQPRQSCDLASKIIGVIPKSEVAGVIEFLEANR